jgi:hypothetical protein
MSYALSYYLISRIITTLLMLILFIGSPRTENDKNIASYGIFWLLVPVFGEILFVRILISVFMSLL